MRQFIVGKAAIPRRIRVIVGGKSSSGKTHFASTWPKPLFLSDATEGGAATLESMDRSMWWDEKAPPEVWEIENMLEMPRLVTDLLSRKAAFPWQTIVIDSLSIYAGRVLRELKGADPKQDGRQRYGELSDALSSLVARMHALPAHIVWLCHIDEEMQLTVPGRASAALWAYMSYKWLCHVVAPTKSDALPEYQLHIRPFLRADWLGGRSRINAPSPMIPSFKCMAELLGLPERPMSPACPDFGGHSYPDGASYLVG
jgi:hypothetical protein